MDWTNPFADDVMFASCVLVMLCVTITLLLLEASKNYLDDE